MLRQTILLNLAAKGPEESFSLWQDKKKLGQEGHLNVLERGTGRIARVGTPPPSIMDYELRAIPAASWRKCTRFVSCRCRCRFVPVCMKAEKSALKIEHCWNEMSPLYARAPLRVLEVGGGTGNAMVPQQLALPYVRCRRQVNPRPTGGGLPPSVFP